MIETAIKDYVETGKILSIAKAHNIPSSALYKELAKRGLVKKRTWKLSKSQKASISHLIRKGYKPVDIGKLFPDVSRDYIYKTRQRQKTVV